MQHLQQKYATFTLCTKKGGKQDNKTNMYIHKHVLNDGRTDADTQGS